MIREIQNKDKDMFIRMVKDFYNSEAVLHNIPENFIIQTYDEVISNSPYAKAYIIDDNNETAGYCLISLTYSNEAGGLVVWIEELYIRNKFRGLGMGSEFLDFMHKEFSGKAKRYRLELSRNNQSAERMYLRKGYKPLEYLQMVHDIKGYDNK